VRVITHYVRKYRRTSHNFARFLKFGISLVLVCCSLEPCVAAPKGQSPIISTSKSDKLVYDADAHGNRVPDYSTCGYAGGDKEIPIAPVRIVVSPIKGDETVQIQKAIDYVSGLAADSNGIRGAVLLLKGRHEVTGGLQITNSGVALRGQGMNENGTTLVAAGLDRRTLLSIHGRNDRMVQSNENWRLTDDYVPVGALRFSLKDTSGLKVGDAITITRPCTKKWIDAVDANEFGGGEGGGWKPGTRDLVWDRVITGIDGNTISIDAPITTAIETDFGNGELKTYSWAGRISNIGVENLRLESTFDALNPADENHSWFAITMENTQDAWVRQVTFRHFAGSAVAVYETCKRITAEDCLSLDPVSENGGSRRQTFFTMGQQTLFLRCFSEHGRHDFSVGFCAAGPSAFVQCEAKEALDDSGGIECWSSGTLFDNVRIDNNALTLGYRPGNNAAVGWAAANSVLWNCSASVIRCWNPPEAQNWSFGSWGGFEGDGIWRNSNGFMKPESLYVAQLAERTGRRIQIMSRVTKESSNPTVEEAAELIAASSKPAPQLSDYIAAAPSRGGIPSDPGTAPPVDSLPQSVSPQPVPRHPISINSNGWLICDAKLVTGSSLELTWWRGSTHPDEAPTFGPSLTRFVPGRNGLGFTDDINELADMMAQRGHVALDHHYGLWYDLRRDDHERVRRMDGDVLPPFFEQPFARTGQGRAWDGLSKYDLTKFNPWYWSRLKRFADVADERGLVLFNEHYFQHNIIEAGAHWVDCPWRTANNINNTGFPEPPPFAGDKRIFMAEQFYDATEPVRRTLHQGFIRQNLDNFKGNANVIQFTSAEFSGPLHFVQFWLDTVGEWERENKHNKPLIALAAPKNVQDGILVDAKRAAIVDVIAFRYWWQTDEGLYAPEGGQNLAPRQFQRQLAGGAPSDVNLAEMAAEYRAKFPSKAIIAASEQGLNLSHSGWAYLCAGGSMPNLPRSTDATLLVAIPRMQAWSEASKNGRWVLREPGRQFLIYSSRNESAPFDLPADASQFLLRRVNARTGELEAQSEIVQGGSKLSLPQGMVWLTKSE
jgi:hypothetical protein